MMKIMASGVEEYSLTEERIFVEENEAETGSEEEMP